MATFSMADDEGLVEHVSCYPQLYDASVSGYKDTVMRDNIWREIGENLYKTGEDCRKRWKSLRDSFFRIKKKNKISSKRKWHLYDRLGFLNRIIEERSALCNIVEEPSTEFEDVIMKCETEMTQELPEMQMPVTMTVTRLPIMSSPSQTKCPQNNIEKRNLRESKKKRKRLREENELTETTKCHEEPRMKNRQCSKHDENSNQLYSFTEYIRCVLQSLPKRLMIEAKSEIFQLLAGYEMATTESSTKTSKFEPSNDILNDDVQTLEDTEALPN